MFLLLAGAGVRIYGSWCMRHQHNMDAGVVAIMAKHIAEGREFPVFFYGQPHMGSLEAFVSAFFCKLIGISGFAVSLGTALVGFLTLPFLYLWARSISGRFAGLVATAFCVVGPVGYFHYNASPRGGYAATLTFAVAVLWLSSHMAVRWAKEAKQSGWEFLALGLLAGLGWWSHQLTTSAILASGLILLIAMRRHAFTWRILSGLAGFFIGSGPFWYYNLVNGWPSFGFLDSFGRLTMAQGLRLFFTTRFIGIMTLDVVPYAWMRIVAWVLVALMLLLGAGVAIRSWRKGDQATWYPLAALYLFIAISALLFSTSHFAGMNTPRYLLPMLPVVAVLIGVTAAELRKWIPWPIALLPLFVFLPLQWRSLTWANEWRQSADRLQARLESFADYAREKQFEAFFAHVTQHSWNFALNEEFAFVNLQGERYLPYAQKAELTERLGIIGNYGGILQFCRSYGGRCSGDQQVAGRFTVFHEFQSPIHGMREIPFDEWAGAVDWSGHDVLSVVSGPDLNSGWRARHHPDPDWIEVRFHEPQVVSALRLVTDQPKAYPLNWSLEYLDTDGNWRTLVAETSFNSYYWSGDRVYNLGATYRFQVHFEPVTAVALRVHGRSERADWRWTVRVMQIFAPDDDVPGEREMVPALLDWLEQRGIRRLYADRYVANRVHVLTGGAIRCSLEPNLFAEFRDMFADERLTPDTALVTRLEDAAMTRRSLEAIGVVMRETALPPWMLFDFSEDGWRDGYDDAVTGHWAGFGLLLTNTDPDLRARMLEEDAAEMLEANPADETAMALLEEALRVKFHLHSARELLIKACKASGRHEEAERLEQELREWTQPEHPATIRFANGVEFLGITMEPAVVERGASCIVRYYWRIPPAVRPDRFVAFVHILQDRKIRFQDDYALIEELPGSFGRAGFKPEILMVDNTVQIPEDLPPGEYDIRLGLYDRITENRLRLQSDLPQRRRAVILPASLRVE